MEMVSVERTSWCMPVQTCRNPSPKQDVAISEGGARRPFLITQNGDGELRRVGCWLGFSRSAVGTQ